MPLDVDAVLVCCTSSIVRKRPQEDLFDPSITRGHITDNDTLHVSLFKYYSKYPKCLIEVEKRRTFYNINVFLMVDRGWIYPICEGRISLLVQ